MLIQVCLLWIEFKMSIQNSILKKYSNLVLSSTKIFQVTKSIIKYKLTINSIKYEINNNESIITLSKPSC